MTAQDGRFTIFLSFSTQKGGKALDAIPNSAMLQTRIWRGGGRISRFSAEIPAPHRGGNLDSPPPGSLGGVGTLKKIRRKQRDGYFNIF